MLNLKILWVKVTTNTLPSENIPSVYSTSQRINAALGTVAGNNTSVPLDHELPSGPSGQICHFSWLLGWPQLIIPALCGARRCQEMSQGAPCPSLTPLSAGRCFSLVWGFFFVFIHKHHCVSISAFFRRSWARCSVVPQLWLCDWKRQCPAHLWAS